MSRELEQITHNLEIARERMNQARDRLAAAIVVGDTAAEIRLKKVLSAAIVDYGDIKKKALEAD